MPVVNLPLYQKPPVAPVDVPNAYYGVHALPLAKTHSSLTSALTRRLTIITDQTIDLEVLDGQYGWFYIREDVENVRFMDLSVNLYGGWDGAGWPDDGDLGETQGPIRITDSEGKGWNLFRTDFPSTGNRVFRVSFEAPVDDPVVVPPEPEPGFSGPMYGKGRIDPINEGSVTATLIDKHSAVSGQTFTLITNSTQYGYFAVPGNKLATFKDTSSNTVGGWDGAGWALDGSIGDTFGPVRITIDGQPWHVYRTDFAVAASKTYEVTYSDYVAPAEPTDPEPEEPEEPTEPEEPQLPPEDPVPQNPIYGVGIIDQPYSRAAVLGVLRNNHPAQSGQTLSIAITNPNHYGYFAVQKSGPGTNYNGVSFVDQANNFPGGWDGASWPTDGNMGEEFGPVEVTMGSTVWLVYRTDFPGSGNKNFTVTFS